MRRQADSYVLYRAAVAAAIASSAPLAIGAVIFAFAFGWAGWGVWMGS